ncbi:MAG: prephenate dehydratase [Bryobacteraceae bacterium]
MKARNTQKSAAFQGEEGAFSYSAALKLLGPRAKTVPCPSFKEVFERLASGSVTHAVVPIENTLHGSVHENYDHLLQYDFTISGETSVRISHHLIAMPGVSLHSVRRAYSHPVALNQCRSFFEAHTQIEPMPFYDTAGSVKMLQQQNPPGAAAVASQGAAEIYGGKILKRNIEDDRQNFTRFFLLSEQPSPVRSANGAWKTSLVFSTPNTPGALFRAMACFALRDLNLTKMESRPLRGKPWEYLFYLDVLGSKDDKPMRNAIAHLSETTQFVKTLGSYRPTL